MSLRFCALMEKNDAFQLNALQLAYLGDSVWEMMIRYQLISQKYNVHHMHNKCVSLVNAHAQYQILQMLMNELTPEETEIVRRGRNAHPKHAAPKNQSADEYAASTGFEALLGFLYITGQDERIHTLYNIVKEVNEHG